MHGGNRRTALTQSKTGSGRKRHGLGAEKLEKLKKVNICVRLKKLSLSQEALRDIKAGRSGLVQ